MEKDWNMGLSLELRESLRMSLRKDLKEKVSSQSMEQVPYVEEAIAYNEYFLSYPGGTLSSLKEEEEEDGPVFVSV